MRPLRFAINVTLDGCCDHTVGVVDEELHLHHAANLARADALILGRATYEMMEQAWRRAPDGSWPAWMADWMVPFAETIDVIPKHVVSSTLDAVDWNADLVRGDPAIEVRRLKEEPGTGLAVSGLRLALALATVGLIDEYEFVVHPVIAGRGPSVFEGLRAPLALELIDRVELRSGAVALTYRPGEPPD